MSITKLIKEEFDCTKDGAIKSTLANVRRAIAKIGLNCSYDELHDRLIINGKTISEYAGQLSDEVCLVLRRIIFEAFRFEPGRDAMFDAASQLCLFNRFDPVCAYLDSLTWDGTKRIDTWLIDYAGAEDTKLNRAIGRIMLVAMVPRARQPGCKFDQIIVLEGVEGTQKSSLLAALAGTSDNFSDQTILGLNDREQQERLRGKWVFEIADLTGIRRAEVEAVKAFASRTHDRARPAYGRAQVELPRRSIICATTNDEEYLKSRTGNRRFWPVKTGTILLEDFKRDRDQLLAEAAAAEAEGESITLAPSLWGAASEAQKQRMVHDPWDDKLASLAGAIVGEEERISSDELLSTHLAIPAAQQVDQHTKRLADVMKRLGWSGPKKLRFGDTTKRGYWRCSE